MQIGRQKSRGFPDEKYDIVWVSPRKKIACLAARSGCNPYYYYILYKIICLERQESEIRPECNYTRDPKSYTIYNLSCNRKNVPVTLTITPVKSPLACDKHNSP